MSVVVTLSIDQRDMLSHETLEPEIQMTRAQTPRMVAEEARDQDVYAWLLDQAQKLRRYRPDSVDWFGLAEELEDIVALQRAKAVSLLALVQSHLLKWKYSKVHRSEHSWLTTLNNNRLELTAILDESKILRNELPGSVLKAYKLALAHAGKDMRLKREVWQRLFPAQCPYTLEQLLDIDYLPDLAPDANGRS